MTIPLPEQESVIIEGSVAYKGLQPDYYISAEDVTLMKFLDSVQKEAEGFSDPIDKISFAIEKVKETFGHTAYNNPKYLELLRRHRESQSPITIGAYIEAGVGVCREHALLIHLILSRLGLNPTFIYAQTLPSLARKYAGTVDHAFNVVRFNGQNYIVDSYLERYNGLRLEDLQKGILFFKSETAASWREKKHMLPGKIFRIHSFPKMKTYPSHLQCKQLFQLN